MRAVRVQDHSGPQGVRVVDIPEPTPRDSDLLVDVHAVAPAYPDLLLSRGTYQLKPTLPFVLGGDFAGIVREAPEGSPWQRGSRVAGSLPYGAAAEVVAVDPRNVYPLPDRFSFAEGAALPLNYLTAHFALKIRAGLLPGEQVLVHGGAGGVGLAVTQVARALGATVLSVVSTPEKARLARQAGAAHAIGREDLPATVRELTNDKGVDVIVDVVGGDLTDSLRSLAPLGRLLTVGFTSGEIPTVKVNRLLLTNTDVRGVELQYMLDAGLTHAQWAELMNMANAGFIAPTIVTGSELADFGDALLALEERRVLGRIVLTVGSR